jgi:hypothetical protein
MATARAGTVLDINHHLVTWQMRRQRTVVAQGSRTRSGTSAPASRIAVGPPGQGSQPDQNDHFYDCSYERSYPPSQDPPRHPCPKRITETIQIKGCRRRNAYKPARATAAKLSLYGLVRIRPHGAGGSWVSSGPRRRATAGSGRSPPRYPRGRRLQALGYSRNAPATGARSYRRKLTPEGPG